MSRGKDYRYMIETIHRIDQDVDLLRLKMLTLSDYAGMGKYLDEEKEILNSLKTLSQICRNVYIDLITLETEDREDFLNGNGE